MKTILLFIVVCVVFVACTTERADPENNSFELSCNTENPIQDLPWLRMKVDTLNSYAAGYRAVKLVEFRGDGYFVIEEIYSSSPGGSIYNCQGDRALKILNVGYNDFIKSAKEIKILYKKN